MLKNYFLITLRSMMKNKLHIFINIFGLAIAVATCIVSYYNYSFNSSFDHNHKNLNTIYRVNSTREFQNESTTYGYVPMGLGNAVKETVSDVDRLTRYYPDRGDFRIGVEIFSEGIQYVDPDFFNMFTFEFLDGSGSSIADKRTIIISEGQARKYFNDVHATGKVITQMLDSGMVKEYFIGGVYKRQAENSSFGFEGAYTLFNNQFDNATSEYNENSWKYRTELFIQINAPSRLATVISQIQPLTENNNRIREDFIIKAFVLDPLKGMGVRDSYNERPGTWTREASPLAAVMGTAMMGILILLIACFNLTNTSIAISSGRLKEIGIRKVMGSERKHLILQFMGETVFICFISLILGGILAEFFLIPAFNEMWENMKLETNYFGTPDFTLFMIGTLLFVALAAGSYPALYISKFQSIAILKGKLKFGDTNPFTRVLLTLQFAISLIGIVCSFAFVENAKFQREFDLGFKKSDVIYSQVENKSDYEVYKNELAKDPEIKLISGTEHHFFANYYNDPVKSGDRQIEIDILNVGDDYLKTMGLTLIEGRDFVRDSETDRKESVIVTEGLTRKFGWKDAIGKEIIWMDTVKLYVVGVIRDVYSHGLWDQLEPTMLRYGDKEKVSYIVVNGPADKITDINKYMESKWSELFPNKMYRGRYMDEEIVEANTVNNNIMKMFVFLGAVALFLSATGLFTMLSLNIIKRMKEIGVRKVLGASTANISKVVNMEFVVILLIASGLGVLGGSFMASMLMSGIWNYYLKATVSTLVISVFLMLFISFVSIVFKTYNAARMNPAKTLRDE
ncbi:MAG: ABC transporter permease [Cyclobacteriaceae bacterium]|nr:ABC transporter permease [Cyclobacteriaceae bacterium]